MAFHRITVVVLLLAFSSSSAEQMEANPVRKVVTMLQMMQNKVEAESKKAVELFEKFQCYCETSEANLGKSTEEAKERIAQLVPEIKASVEHKAQLEGELVTHKSDRVDANEAIEKSSAIRLGEANTFAKDSAYMKTNIDALAKAIPAIEKGTGGSFMQTRAGSVLRQLSMTMDLSSIDRDVLSSFLSQSQGDGAFSPGSGEIIGILKQMKSDMEKDLADLITQEEGAASDFESLKAAKQKEIAADTAAIESKTARVGDLEVAITTMNHDLEDTQESEAEDGKVLAALKSECEDKLKVHEASAKMTAQELVALADTIKMLNDDDALDLFKKTLPSSAASFIQLSSKHHPQHAREEALHALRKVRGRGGRRGQLDFIALALRGKKSGFDEIVKLIDAMVITLGVDQQDDDKKKEYCALEFDTAEDKQKGLEKSTSDQGKVIDEQEDILGSVNEEVAELEAGITELDLNVAKATEQRKQEHAEVSANLAANNAAKELIEMAKNRMDKFYNPKMHNPDKASASAFIQEGSLDQAAFFAQVKVRTKAKDEDQDEDESENQDEDVVWDQSAALLAQKRKQEAGGVIAMMTGLKNDLEMEIQAMKLEEKDSQGEYETMMADFSEKRATDSKAMTTKDTAKAELEDELQKTRDAKKATDGELHAVSTYLAELHDECDWLLQNFGARKEARANEIDALGKAKAVLSGAGLVQTGAGYSLLQTGQQKQLRRVNRK